MKTYPEHEKLKVISQYSNKCGEFLEHLYSKGYILAEYAGGELWSVNRSITDLLAEFFKIDQQKIDQEKLEMLEEVRNLTLNNK